MLLIFDFEDEYNCVKYDLVFWVEMDDLWVYYVGRFSLLYFVLCLIEELGGVKIYLKCEELNYIGSYKINNVLG